MAQTVVTIHIGPVSCIPGVSSAAGGRFRSNQCWRPSSTPQCGVWTGNAVRRMETKAKCHESRDS
ncbi:hypothetical protein IG631_19402 [Alternaria alternata]|nr:hypothetical protein IG631_19402 [Alternaria alternata]